MTHRLVFLRKKLGISQSDLALKLNISPSAVGMYEQGRRVPSIEMLVAMSRVFGVSLDYLITGQEYSPAGSNDKTSTLESCPCCTCFWKEYVGL